MNQQEALEVAKKMNADGFKFLFGGNIRFVAQNADGEWNGFRDEPCKSIYDESWDNGHGSICLDREWNDDWENTLAEVGE